MIHYHGGDIWPLSCAQALWVRRHGFVSFARPTQISLAAEICQSFALDNGAFSVWKRGGAVDWEKYAAWVREWWRHPGFDWCVIPDSIDGGEPENDRLLDWWLELDIGRAGVPVWHLHESLERLERLVCSFDRVALGSSGEFKRPGTRRWWVRMAEVMEIVCDESGRPRVKLHGLRMLDPTIFSHLPLSSGDAGAARNAKLDKRWPGPYQPLSKEARIMVLVDRIEHHASAARWVKTGGIQKNFELVG